MANFITITGRLGQDVETKMTTNGTKMLMFSIADDQSYTKKDKTKVERTCWIPVVDYRPEEETFSQYLTKGKEVTVHGELTSNVVEKEEGNRTFYQVRATRVILHGGSKKED